MRKDGRGPQDLRPVRIHPEFTRNADGSVLIEMGETRVICTACVEDRVPPWMKNAGIAGGWVTAEYGMLPGSTSPRTPRETKRQSGRTMEIQRLIGRSLRAVVDMALLGERTIWIDCDVIQADGGTRTASISGAYVALCQALRGLQGRGVLAAWPVKDFVAAVSVGIVGKILMLDLNYEEDSSAEVDMNLVMTGSGNFVELQSTGERATFDSAQLGQLIKLGENGIRKILEHQKRALSPQGTVSSVAEKL